ncbi:MAG: hypothetical protein ACO3VO_05625 [Ilumatobacteraceae bacterium]
MTDRTLLLVVWRDAHAVTDTWTHIDELDVDDCVVVSVGIVLPDAKQGHLVLAQSMIDGENTVDGVLAIPHGMIISETVIVA